MEHFRVEDLNALLSLSLEIIPALVFIHRGGNLLYVNRACEEVLGYSREEILNMPFWEIVHPEHREMVKERALKRLKGEMVPERYEMKVLCKGGVEKWFDMRVRLVDLKDGPVILASALDITELKEKEEALKQLNYELDKIVQDRTYKLLSLTKDMETLLYAISHNLKSPLRAIEGFAELLELSLKEVLSERDLHYLNNILHASRRMRKMLEDLSRYSKIGLKGVVIEAISVEDVLEDVLFNLKEKITSKNGEISIRKPIPHVKADRTLLELILSNLIDNALTYVSKDTSPKVEISAFQEGHYVVISIKDNGIGIPHKFREKIFDLFQRLHSEEEYPGTGIGLAIAKKAVELLGGEIRVESEVGFGSTFFVKLKGV